MEKNKIQNKLDMSKRSKAIYYAIYVISLYALKFGINGTIYDVSIWFIDTIFFWILKQYIVAIKGVLVSKKQKNDTKSKSTKRKLTLNVLLNSIKIYGTKKFISFVLVSLIPILMFIFLVFVGFKVNYKANIDEFEKIVSSKCTLVTDNIHNLENISKILVTDEKVCGYEIGFIVTSDRDETTYQTMLKYIKYEITPYVPGGREYNMFRKEYTTIDSYHYKSIYKKGNNIVYAIAPMDKKDDALWIIRELGYTSIPSFDNIFN